MRSLAIITCLLFMCTSGVTAQTSWTQKASMSGKRYIASSFTIGQYAYVGTGYTATLSTLSDWWKYDPSTDSWSQIASSPVPYTSASTFTIDGKGYVAAGLASTSQFQTGTYMYDPVPNMWTTKTPLPGTPRFGSASFSIGSNGYVCCGNFGSSSGPFTDEVWAYDAVSDTWMQKADFPGAPRYACRGTSLHGYGYLFSGTNGTGSSPSHFLADLWEYDPQTDSWAMQATPPTIGRSYASVCTLDNKVVVGCGVHSTGYRGDFFSFDPVSGQWNMMPSLPAGQERWAAVAFSLANKAYIASGNKSSNNPIIVDRDLWVLDGSTTSMDELHEAHIVFNVYPNPAGHFVNVMIDELVSEDLTFSIYSISGKVVFAAPVSGTQFSIPVDDLASGRYIVTIASERHGLMASQSIVISTTGN